MPTTQSRLRTAAFAVVAILVAVGILAVLDLGQQYEIAGYRLGLPTFWRSIFILAGIYVTLALGLNLINGFTGLFSLGHAGFMAVGAYTVALTTMPPATKQQVFLINHPPSFIMNFQIPFWAGLILGTLAAAFVAWLVAIPSLRLSDDYLAIATLGFGEIIRVLFTNLDNITNGAQGITLIPTPVEASLWWSWGVAILVVVFMFRLVGSSFGRSLKAIRENEIAAEAMGINLYRTKITSFVIGSALAGLGGGLLAGYLGTVDPKMFNFLYTFNILLIVVLGGLGSISGSVIAAIVVTMAMEWLRILDGRVELWGYAFDGAPGVRMVVFSLLLMIVVIFWREGLMGKNELTPAFVRSGFRRRGRRGRPVLEAEHVEDVPVNPEQATGADGDLATAPVNVAGESIDSTLRNEGAGNAEN